VQCDLVQCWCVYMVEHCNILVGWCIRVTQGWWVHQDDRDSLDQLDRLAILVQQVQTVLLDRVVEMDFQVDHC